MSKWMGTPDQFERICEAQKQLWDAVPQSCRIAITLVDGTTVTGQFAGLDLTHNDGGASDNWRYSGSLTIETEAGQREIDMADIQSIVPAP